MALPQVVTDVLNESAQRNGVENPKTSDDLFESGVLDSFTLIEFVTTLESACGISVPDQDVVPANFQTIEKIEQYVEEHRG